MSKFNIGDKVIDSGCYIHESKHGISCERKRGTVIDITAFGEYAVEYDDGEINITDARGLIKIAA